MPPDAQPAAGLPPSGGDLTALRHKRAFLLDMDGVIYTGNTPIAGAPEFFRFLAETGRAFQCITNNSTLTADQFVQKLAAMDIHVTPEHVLTSSQAAALALRERLPQGARIFAIGEEGLVRALIGAGFHLVQERAQAVVCGLDRRLTYRRLTQACFALREGATFVATNPDHSMPTELGQLPGNGAALAYLQTATGLAPTVIGKPEATMLEVAMHRLGVTPQDTVMVGDGLLTDIVAGQRAGVAKVLVLTGVSAAEDVRTAPAPPDFVFANLNELREALGPK
jgi:4-nitrophenyl phosphatase